MRVKEAILYAQRKGSRITDPVLDQQPREAELIQNFAITKATANDWRRPDVYFAEADVGQATGIRPDLIYPILDGLRNVGRLACVNWRGSPVWTPTDDLMQATRPTDQYRIVAQTAAYTFLARAGIVNAETLLKARNRALEALKREYPDLTETTSLLLANVLDEAMSAAIDELRSSSRRVRFDETTE